MNSQTLIRAAATLLVLLTACGPSITRNPSLERAQPRLFAMLPISYPSDIRPERAEYVRASLLRSLGSNGFVILDDHITARICSTAACPERQTLVDRYGVDGFIEIALSSVNRVNFLAGFYNNISGTVRLLDQRSQELFKIEDTASERGGLVFNSGQVIEGIASSVSNLGDDSFSNLAEEFARKIALQLPRSSAAALPETAGAIISEVRINLANNGRHELCAAGTRGATALLHVNRIQSPLRETAPGRYCGVFVLEGLVIQGSKFAVELRSPYGAVARKELDAEGFIACSAEGLVMLEATDRQRSLRIGCAATLPEAQRAECLTRFNRCKESDFIVYRADTPAGAFRRLGVSKLPLWTDRMPTGRDIYAVMSFSKRSGGTVPVVLNAPEKSVP